MCFFRRYVNKLKKLKKEVNVLSTDVIGSTTGSFTETQLSQAHRALSARRLSLHQSGRPWS